MSIQLFRTSIVSLGSSYIGRQRAKANIGSTGIFARFMKTPSMKYGSNSLSLSTRRCKGMTIYSPSRTIEFPVKRISNSFFARLRDVAYSVFFTKAPLHATQPSILPITTLTPGSLCNMPSSSPIISWAIWLIKRTYQPSLLKKKRQCGYMKRRQSVGGRRILKRRRKKGRKRLFGA